MSDPTHIESALGGLNLQKSDFVFIPVNDNEQNTAGGSHWSLLIYSRSANCYYYYDSMGRANYEVAKRTKKKLDPANKPNQSCGLFDRGGHSLPTEWV
ncbi:hypothetical protein DFJ73DRAFT_88381 [Zopfochytrium polystomum]|nr:hypothetical protein DFJ73DRAFT_88381 [Zopfochytrium polystomum]